MRRNLIPLISFLIAAGLEVSPLSDWWLSISAWGIAVILAAFVWGPQITPFVFKRLLAVLPWEFRLEVIPKNRSDPKGESAPRGFLDFVRDAQRSIQVFSRNVELMSKDMNSMSAKVDREVKAVLAERGRPNPSIERIHKKAGQAARLIEKCALDMGQHLAVANQAQAALAKDFMSYCNWVPASEEGKTTLIENRANIQPLNSASAAREGMVSLRKTIIGLRDAGISQDITGACNKMIVVMDQNIDMLSAVLVFVSDAVKIIDDKLAQA